MKRILLFFIVSFLLIGVSCSSDTNNEQSTEKEATEEVEEEESDVRNTDETEEDTSDNNQEQADQSSEDQEVSSKSTDVTDDLVVHYIDANQADATLLQYVHNDQPYTVLFDVGDWNRKDVVNYLHEQDVSSIDLIIISHPHADHIGQLAQIMDEFSVEEVWFSGNTASSGTYQKAAEAVLESDTDYYEPRAGETFDVGSLGIEVLHPSTLTGALNEDSISVKITYGDIALLFTGDAYQNEELQMIERTDDIKAHILQLGHHGSRTSTHPDFIQAVQPEVAIYSAGTGNTYGHPHIEAIDTIRDADVDLYGTDVHGTIIVTTDGTTYELTTSSKGEITPGDSTDADTKSDKPKKADQPKKDSKKSSSSSCIDINEASVEELEQIKHIGSARAEELIDLRPFDSVEDLSKLKGIGPARITDILDEGKACVGGD